MNSKSEMRRIAIQNPESLIGQIIELKNENKYLLELVMETKKWIEPNVILHSTAAFELKERIDVALGKKIIVAEK